MNNSKSDKLTSPPLWLKLSYTLFVVIFIPVYWVLLGPKNFLWFSDVALFLTVYSLWRKCPLTNSMMFLAVVLLESIWIVDVSYQFIMGETLIGLAAYMFDPNEKTIIKTLSGIFHFGMPATIIYLTKLWGYDRRALLRQSLLAILILLLTHWAKPAENINWVRGLFGKEGFTLGLEQPYYLLALLVLYPLLIYMPVHFLMKKFVRPVQF